MPKHELWNPTFSRVELNQRAREARLRLERIERLLAPRAVAAVLRLRLRPIRLRPRGLRGYDAGGQGECSPPSGIVRPPSPVTRAADPAARPVAPAWPGGADRALPQAA